MKKTLVLFCVLFLFNFLLAQKKYVSVIDSLTYYFQYVSIQNKINTYAKSIGFDSLLSVASFSKKHFYNPPRDTVSNIEKSIIILSYKFHTCILDLNVFTLNSVIKNDSNVVLNCSDTTEYLVFYNSNIRLEHGKGFYRLNKLAFKASGNKYLEKFYCFLRESILVCNRYCKKPKILNIRRYDMFDEINNK